jgi:uncharacterized membrane protein YdfJ with MMPL/SSD domain
MHTKESWLYRGRLLIIIGALLLIGLAAGYGGGLFASLTSGGFDVPGSDSLRAQQLLDRYLHGATPDLILLMQADQLQPTDPTFQTSALALLTRLQARREVSAITSYYSTHDARFLSRDGRETLALIQLAPNDESQKEQAYRTIEPLLTAPPLRLTVGGNVPFNVELNQQISKDLEFAELISFPLVAVLLLIIFGSVIAALLPLLIGGVTILGAFALLRLATTMTPISVFAINVVTMLGLGLAIDYALLIVTRFREELRRQEQNVPRALRRTLQTAGRAVLFSALTVSVSLSGLLLFPEVFLRSLGLGAISAVVIALLSALILLPALLALLGRRVNLLAIRPGLRRTLADEERRLNTGPWARLAGLVMRHPLPILLGVVLLLLLLGQPFLGVSFSTPDTRVLPASASARSVAEELARNFPAQGASQAVIVIKMPGDALAADNLARLARYVEQIEQLPGVLGVESLVTVDPSLSLAQYQQLYRAPAQSPPLAIAAQQLANGPYTKVTVSMQYADLSAQASDLVEHIRALPTPAGLTALVGGATAHQIDLFASLRATIPAAATVIVIAILLLLFLMTGSLLVPLKALLMNLLSLTATFGALVWIFQQGHGASLLHFTSLGSIDGTQPVLIFAIAFGLSMDYEVFLLSRIKEEYDRSGDNQRAVASGLQRTGGLITSAALLLAVVLAAFSTSQIIFIKEIGVGLAIAVLLDASIIRVLLVPATMRLLGALNWWAPRPLQALWQRLGLSESAAPDEQGRVPTLEASAAAPETSSSGASR